MANTKKKGLIYYLDKIYKAIKGSDQLPPEGDPSVDGHMANVNKKGLLYYLDIIGDALEEWSPGPGPGPSDISKCVQVDRTQSFSDAEKARGRANLGISVDDFVSVMRKVAGYTLENDITEQQVQDAIKELTAILKNKTIDADDNTISNLETDNFKDTALAKSTDAVRSLANSVDTKLTTEKFLQKTLHNIELPEEDKDAANKKYVDELVAELEWKILKFKGFVSPTAPTGSIKNGSFWYQGTAMPSAFPVNVRTYNATTGQWSSSTKQYTPDALDLWANLNDSKGYYWFGNAWNMLDDNGKVMFVSTFTGLTGDQKMLYYLDTAYGSYKKGFYRYNGTAFVNINPKEFFIVSTFTGVVGDDEALYYLDTAYGDYKVGFYRFIPASGSTSAKFVLLDKAFVQYVSTFGGVTGDADVLYYLDTAYGDYKKGFYRFIPTAGSTPAKFELIGAKADVFTDVDELPDANISKDTIYRIPYSYYEYQGQKVEKEDAIWYGPGAQCLNMACDNTNGLALESASRSYQYPLADITDALVQQLITDELIQVKSTETDAPMFKAATDSYCPTEDVTEVDGGYKLYHNPTETAGEYIEIGGDGAPVEVDDVTVEQVRGKLQANAVIDVVELPTTGIKAKSLYRTRDMSYEYEGVQFPKSELVWYGPGPNCTSMDADDIGVNIRAASGNRSYPWGTVDAALIQELSDLGLVAVGVTEADAVFFSHLTTYGPKSGLTTIYGDYHLYHNPSQTAGGYIEIGGGDVTLDDVTTETVDGKVQANAIIDVNSLPTADIKAKTIYRMLVDKYYEDGNVLPARPTGYVSSRPAIVIIDANGITDNGTFYAWADITDDQMDFWVIRRQISEVYAADLMTMSACFKTAANHYVYKDHVTKDQVYELYHNPTATANAFIKIGGESSSVEVDEVTTEEVNGKVQANAVIVVNTLPTTGIKTKSLYRRMQTAYKHDGVEVTNVAMYKVHLNDDFEVTPDGFRYKLSGNMVTWDDPNIGFFVDEHITSGEIVAATWDDVEFFAYGDGEYDYESHFSRILPGSLWQNPTGTAAGWEEVGGEQAIDEVTIVKENSILRAVAVIDVTSLPSAGMKVNSLYRKVETVMVPGMHIFTTYYEGGTVPVPEPVECYKPARAGVEFRSNEIYIDGVEHSYEELRAYREVWVQMGYIVACDFLEIDTTTNDGGVGYPYEGSYQFLNRDKYTYTTDPVPVVMNKIFQRTPGGEWESISTVQISQAAYNALDYDQKMDGTTYIVEG